MARQVMSALPEPVVVPQLVRKPGFLRRAAALPARGAVAGSPCASLDAALESVRALGESRRVYLITRTPAGWAVFEYEPVGIFGVDLGSLRLDELPLGGSTTDPQTYLRDGRGSLGKIMAGPSDGEFLLRRIDKPFTPAPLPPSDVLPFVVPHSMENDGRNVAWRPRFALRPGSDVAALSRSLEWITRRLRPAVKVKAGGWRHSWSPVVWTDGVYIHPEGMNGVVAVRAAAAEATILDPAVDQRSLYAVLAGTRIREISAALWADGSALPYLGGWDGQTLGGVLPTGTHGSALRHGPLAEMVRSVDLVRFDGGKVRIEPQSRAITAPQRFHELRPDWELIQDDAAFNALLISMGSMGVCHRFIIEVRDRFWLREMRTVTTMGHAEQVLRGGNIYHLMETAPVPAWVGPVDDRHFGRGHPKPAYHLELLWNPYSDKLVVTTRHYVDDTTRARFQGGKEPEWFAHAPIRDLFRVLKLDVMAAKYSRPDVPELLTELFPRTLDKLVELAARLAPSIVPWVLDNSLKEMKDPNGYTQRSFNVFNIGQGANSIPAQSSTISIPLQGDRWLEAIAVLREVARAIARERHEYQTGPISLRFVRGSAIFLADPVDVCKFELIFGGNSERVRALSQHLVRAYYLALAARFGADVRFHWGQLIPTGTLETPGPAGESRVRAAFPRYDDWRRQRDAFDPAGRGLNPWQAALLP